MPLHRQEGFDRSTLPGVYIEVPPRRAARGRKKDRLILFLSLEKNVLVSGEGQRKMLQKIAKGYFEIPGTTTSALSKVADSLNSFLLKHNQRVSDESQQIVAALTIFVEREGRMYIAQSGPSHIFILDGITIEYLHSGTEAGRGLGLARTAPVHLSQATVKSGTLLVVTPSLPQDWDQKKLQSVQRQSLNEVRRRLLGSDVSDLIAIAIYTQEGRGELQLLQGPEALDPDIHPAEKQSLTEESVEAPTVRQAIPSVSPIENQTIGTESSYRQSTQDSHRPPPPGISPQPAQSNTSPLDAGVVQAESTPSIQDKVEKPIVIGPAILKAGKRFGQALRNTALSLRDLLTRMLPEEPLFTLPTSTKLLIAIAVPLLVVTVSIVIYSQVGREQQYRFYFDQAQAAADQALMAQDLAERRNHWDTVLFYLEQAESYKDTEEVQALRGQAYQVLDQMNGVTRLDFKSAIAGGLPKSVNITRMVMSGLDLFMLDAVSGAVLHAELTGDNYELDLEFSCRPQQYGAIIVDRLVDIAVMPEELELNEEGAAIAAIDGQGNLLLCLLDEAPLALTLIAPTSLWGDPNSQMMALENGDLYILDPQTNAVWVYTGGSVGFREPPYFFFGDEVPSLQGAIDIAMSGEKLYILYDDGHITTCDFSFVVTETIVKTTTTCTDPATFEDNRLGRENGAVIPEARFFQMTITPKPEPSIFFLDSISHSVYQFGLRLTFADLYRSAELLLDEPITAFTLSPLFAPTRTLFLAIGNDVLMADIP
jgi:hypothetical protein